MNNFNKESFASISPSDAISYLKAMGWAEYRPSSAFRDPYGVSYQKTIDNKEYDVFIPLHATYMDYSSRIALIIDELQEAEQRDYKQIFYDLKYSNYDIVRFRIIHQETNAGELPLEGSSKIIDGAKELFATSACSLTSKKIYYPNPRRTSTAIEYLKKVRVAPSEIGSYIMKMIVRIPPTHQLDMFPEDTAGEPIERTITRNLYTSVQSCFSASQDAIRENNINSFQGKAELGVNANILASLAKMGEIFDENDFDISVSWSANRALPERMDSKISFDRTRLPFIKEAARYLREISPIDNFELTGFVSQLEQLPTDIKGKIKVIATIDHTPRAVNIILTDDVYRIAVRAHDEKKVIRCTGELKKDGRTYILEQPRDFQIVFET